MLREWFYARDFRPWAMLQTANQELEIEQLNGQAENG